MPFQTSLLRCNNSRSAFAIRITRNRSLHADGGERAMHTITDNRSRQVELFGLRPLARIRIPAPLQIIGKHTVSCLTQVLRNVSPNSRRCRQPMN